MCKKKVEKRKTKRNEVAKRDMDEKMQESYLGI